MRRPHARLKQPKSAPESQGDLAPPGPGTLGRVLKYAQKIFGLCDGLRRIKDGRIKPRVPAGRAALAYLMLLLARLGSLNALEQRKAPAAWAKWLGGDRPSADVMGDIAASMELGPLRALLRQQHKRTKRNKGFGRDKDGFRWLILDGHEGVASYRRSWKDCLERVVHFAKGDRTQFYFRNVTAYLTNGRQYQLLDAEAQLPGEGEIACAMRLLMRLFTQCPRAFDIVCGDNAYMDPKLWKLVRSHNKHLIAVLKNEDRDLLVDARSLFTGMEPIPFDDKKVRRLCWDLNGFTTWPQCGEPVRVVRSVETTTVKRQRNKKNETVQSEWFWVTSLPPHLASTKTIVRAGHGRWDIENHGFNELGNLWHGDHAYKYDAHALLACTLLLFIAYNLFHAFIERNLKPQVRAARTAKYWADLIAAEFITLFHPHAAPL
jgi:Transposase DDE domain